MRGITLIKQKILNSHKIVDKDKFKAIEDLILMAENKQYADHVQYNSNVDETQDLSDVFIWNNSIVGRDFWVYIFTQII
jgi:hypothetical protein